MSDPEDVHEYVDEGEVKNFHIRRLLEWLARLGGDRTRRIAVLNVCLSFTLSCMPVGTFWIDNSFSHISLPPFPALQYLQHAHCRLSMSLH